MSASTTPKLKPDPSSILVRAKTIKARLTKRLRKKFASKPALFWIRLCAVFALGFLVLLEADESYLRALVYSQLAAAMHFKIAAGASPAILFPQGGHTTGVSDMSNCRILYGG